MATRITSKQKSARRKNIKIAQQSRKRGGGGSKGSYVQRTTTAKSRKRAGKAFKKAYKEARSFGTKKSHAVRIGLQAAHKAAPSVGQKRARTLARGIGRKMGYGKTGREQFARGFVRALKW